MTWCLHKGPHTPDSTCNTYIHTSPPTSTTATKYLHHDFSLHNLQTVVFRDFPGRSRSSFSVLHPRSTVLLVNYFGSIRLFGVSTSACPARWQSLTTMGQPHAVPRASCCDFATRRTCQVAEWLPISQMLALMEHLVSKVSVHKVKRVGSHRTDGTTQSDPPDKQQLAKKKQGVL